jgi:hypothetical protein
MENGSRLGLWKDRCREGLILITEEIKGKSTIPI